MANSTRPLGRVTLLEGLVAGLTEQIHNGELPVGTQLPGEAALGAQWGVSRPVVREALAMLRDRGYLHTVNGSGTFVRHPDVSHVAAALERHMRLTERDDLTVEHLYEARTAIEVVSARLAALRADARHLGELSRLLEEMDRDRRDPALYTAADVGFHVALAEASKNPLLPTLLTPLVRTIVEGMMQSHRSPQAAALGLKGHRLILQHVAVGDADAAAAAMAEHLAESQKIFPADVLRRASALPKSRKRPARREDGRSQS